MRYPSYIELSKSALDANLKFLKEFIGEDTTFTSVIKGNAYGHGIKHFVPLAEKCGVRNFAVFSSDEAKQAVKAAKDESHIMIMGMIANDMLPWAIEEEVSFFVFEIDRLKKAVEASKKVGKPAIIHLHLETGMNRIGLEEHKVDRAIELILENREHFRVMGLCTHYAGAESVGNHVRVKKQISTFNALCEGVRAKGIEPEYRHTACSAAMFNYPETIMDMVRVGIAQYGFWPSRETYMYFVRDYGGETDTFENPLNRVLSWKSEVMSIKNVEPGEFVGYGNIYMTSRDQTIATVPIGYTHGFGRNLTNVGRVLIHGERVEVVGLVNMNVLTVDVTDLDDVCKGDEVVIIGNQGEHEITVASFSEMQNNLNYEVLSRLPSRLPRYLVD